jgi:hypothetical protein
VGLLRGLFWLALFLFFTFCFLVLFEYGPGDFTNGFQKEGKRLENYVEKKIHPEKKK